MKRSFVVSLLSISASAIHGPTFDPDSAPSRIPQFILDLENDDIKANLPFLQVHENPKEALCHLESPLRASLPFEVPDNLFGELFVDNTRFSTPRLGWQNAQDRLSEILDCPAALESCTGFYVNIYRHDYDDTQQGSESTNITAASKGISVHTNATMPTFHRYDDEGPAGKQRGVGEPVDAPTTLMDLFVNVLTSMPKLQTIEWKGPGGTGHGEHFKQMFTNSQLSLPTVKNMNLASNFLFLATMAPNLESLTPAPVARRQSEEGYRQQVLKIISDLPSIKNVKITSSWDERDFLELYKAVPGLESLDLDGVVDFVDPDYDSWLGKPVQPEAHNLRKYLRLLRLFGQLKTLGLPDPAEFGMHIPSVQGYSFAYEGVLGAKFGRYEAFANMQKGEQAARIIIEELPDLERLCIGGVCTQLRGPEAFKWPWTGRVRDYLLSKYSRCNEKSYLGTLVEDPDGPVFFTWDEDKTWLESGKEPGELRMISPDRGSMRAWDERFSCTGGIR